MLRGKNRSTAYESTKKKLIKEKNVDKIVKKEKKKKTKPVSLYRDM